MSDLHEFSTEPESGVNHGMVDRACSCSKDDRQHVIQGATSCVWLRIDQVLPSTACLVKSDHHIGGFTVEDRGILIDSFLAQPAGGDAPVFSPAVVVWRCCDPTPRKDGLALDEHLLPGGEHRAVCHHEIFSNLRAGNDDEQLVAEPYGIQTSEFLCPFVEGKFRVLCQKREGS